MRKLLTTILLSLCCQAALADQCPSIIDLRKHHFNGFAAYDIDSSDPLPRKRLESFIKHADQFILAEWQDTLDHYGAILCYYRDKDGSEMETYLKKYNLKPGENKKHWYQVSGSMHCAAGMEKCGFNSSLPAKKQLAKK